MGLRSTVDISSESISKKIRNAELMKVPYTVVIGNQELTDKILKPRIRSDLIVSDKEIAPLKVDDFLNQVKNESQTRASKTSLI